MVTKKVFLSSTARDLGSYRQAVYDALESLDGFHCIRMENFGARDSDAVEFDRARVEECDLFIGIIGLHYGNVPRGGTTSFTEMEHEAAVTLAKPRLIFVSSEDLQSREDLSQSDESRRRQEAFRRRLASERIVGFFSSPLDLVGGVVTAVFNWEHGQSDLQVFNSAVNPRWSLVPSLPHPHIAHPYPLQDHFTGRVRERRMLSAWLAEGSHTHLFLVGIGGLGKSALTWVWLHWDVMNQLLPGIDAESLRTEVTVSLRESHRPEGFIWWSFYEANATFSAFLDEALTYASNGEISPERIPSPYYKARMLLALLQQRKLLIIWDGFERLLKAYEGLGGGYREENERESDLRSCVEPLVEKFLVWLASTPIRSRFLVTSRLFPKDLEGVGGIPLASCRREDMTSLDPEDAITLFRLMGVKGTRFEINTVCASYGYHALALRLLCGYIVNHVSQANDIRVALQYDATEELIPRKHHILELAYNALEPSERLLLSRMAAFRSPVGHEAIAYLEVHQTKKGVERAIKVLANRGLIWLDRARGRCDMHPVVRRYAYDRLSDKETVHRRLRAYFATIPKPKYGIRSFEEIYPSIELFHHTVRARLYKDAFTLYKDDLKSMLVQLGAFQTEVELLRVFFRENESFEFLLDEEYDRNQLLLDLSIAYGYIGQERQALRFLEMINKLGSVEYFNTWNILGSMCYFQIKLGQLADATTYQQRAFEAANKSNDRDGQGYSRMMMGLILTIEGQLSKSLEEFRIARSLYRNFQGFNLVRECNLWNFRTIRASLIGEHHLAIVCGRHALSLAESFAEGRLLTRSKAYLASALIDLAVTEPERRNRLLSEAELLLTMALTQCRQLDLIEMEPFLLLAWARWNFLRGDRAQAKKGAEEALSLAQRCEFRLEQADINLFMAHLAFEGGALTLCRHHVEQSRQLAWCDGPPHYYKITFDKSEALLSKLR